MAARISRSPLLSLALAASLLSPSLGAGCSSEDGADGAIITITKGGAGGTAGKSPADSAGQGGSEDQPGQGGSDQPGGGGSEPQAGSGGSGGSAQAGQGGSAQAGKSGGTQTGGSTGSGGKGGSATAGSGGQTAVSSLVFVAPAEGQSFQQTGDPGQVQIHFEMDTSPDIARVDYHTDTGELLESVTTAPDFVHDHAFKIVGNRWVEASGYDAGGDLVTKTKVNFIVKAPLQGGCLDELTGLGVKFTTTKAKGVVDAVNLKGPINGVIFANGLKDEPTGDPISCQFVKTLWSFAEVLKARGFVKVGTLGSYCYRCCCSWSESNYCRGPNDPEPDCSANGYSTHSWGRAVDIRYLTKANGTVYDVNNPAHFVITSGDTCGSALSKQSGISKEMYGLACEAHTKKIFSTILTPNHNSVHRNHFHMDTGKSGAATGATADILGPSFDFDIDSGDHPDDCGGAP